MIELPYDLFHRIRISCEEHNGIGGGDFWDRNGFPVCVHAHAWGTQGRQEEYERKRGTVRLMIDTVFGRSEPELSKYISFWRNDFKLVNLGLEEDDRISFDEWCEIFQVTCERRKNEVLQLTIRERFRVRRSRDSGRRVQKKDRRPEPST